MSKLMDKLDIFELDPEIRVMTTIKELRHLYTLGMIDGDDNLSTDDDVLIIGEIV